MTAPRDLQNIADGWRASRVATGEVRHLRHSAPEEVLADLPTPVLQSDECRDCCGREHLGREGCCWPPWPQDGRRLLQVLNGLRVQSSSV